MLHILSHTIFDTVSLLPFLLGAYLLIEFIEHKAGAKTAALVNKAGRFGPVVGAVMGVVPQCGFSALMSNFYAGGLITRGTLLAVFLSTSDEMLPILLSEQVDIALVMKILAVKVIIAVIIGTLADMLMKNSRRATIGDLCDDADCDCENGIFLSAVRHTVEIALFILAVTFALNLAIEYVGEDRLGDMILNKPIIGEFLAGLIGLIPNCASSIVITELYIEGYLGAGAMLSGLCVGSGVGFLVLLRANRDMKDNLKTLAVLYFGGVAAGILFGALPIF